MLKMYADTHGVMRSSVFAYCIEGCDASLLIMVTHQVPIFFSFQNLKIRAGQGV
jgi:hypothetical protein